MITKEKPWCVVSALLAISVAACVNVDARTTRVGNGDANALQEQLFKQYSELAFRKRSEGNSASARHFEQKAIQAADGQEVAPDRPDNASASTEYARLSAALKSGNVDDAVRARAQVMFDCLLDERQQAVDRDDILVCEQEFERALAIITGMPDAGGAGAS